MKQSKREGDYDLVQRLVWELTKFPFAGFDDLADAMADQLDLVHATKLPVDVGNKMSEGKVVQFIHPSMAMDRKKMKKFGDGKQLEAVR